MKNIHVIQTDKPSRLCYEQYTGLHLTESMISNVPVFRNQHIYITDNSKIKEGDYCIDGGDIYGPFEEGDIATVKFVKIILTTDEQLIRYGVQAIDDEFLEWFVSKANDSGKPIDIVDVVRIMSKGYKIIIPKEEESLYDYGWCKGNVILPKEEQKQHLIDMMQKDEELGLYNEHKEETLEEAANDYSERHQDVSGNLGKYLVSAVFQDGAKWQQEQMYSEEEVIAFGEFIFKHSLLTHTRGVKSLFEQFKKK